VAQDQENSSEKVKIKKVPLRSGGKFQTKSGFQKNLKQGSEFQKNFKQIISRLTPETQAKVLIARADENVNVDPQQTLAKVIEHKDVESKYVRTIVINNTPEVFKAFNVQNVPEHIRRRF